MLGVVYDPPATGLPHMAVILGDDKEVVIAQAVASRAEGETLLAAMSRQAAADKAAGKI